jgi:hypothetical protein
VHDAEPDMFRMYKWYQDGVTFVQAAMIRMSDHDAIAFECIIVDHLVVLSGCRGHSQALSAER